MKKLSIIASIVFATIFLFNSCTKDEATQIAKEVVGVWSVDKIEFVSASDPNSSYTAEFAGTIEFKEDNTGKNNFTYTIADQSYNDSEAFKWENTDTTITIIGNANDGQKEIVYSIDDHDKKTQVWTATEDDGDKNTFTLTKMD